ncbi:MAG: hypothetical protein V2J26_08500 [Pacificimonas sp.]|jgi:hypothetical protein|nr:hypothetical protein [Pacificimonas sp.]
MTGNEFDQTNDAAKASESVTAKIKDTAEGTAETVRENAQAARDYTADRYRSAKDYTADRYGRARSYGEHQLHAAQSSYRQGRQTAAESIQSNPLAAAGLGLLAGMAVGLLLPRTRQENRFIGGYRDELYDQAAEAARAARETGEQEFRSIAGDAKAQAKQLSEKAAEAARHSADAALKKTDLPN